MGWTRFNYSKSGLLAMEGTGSQKMNVLPWEASDRREMLIVGAVDADGHKAAAYFVELYADGKRSLGEWSSSVQVDNWSPSFSAQKCERSSRRVGPCEPFLAPDSTPPWPRPHHDVEGEIDMTERLEEIHSTINQAVYGLLEGHNEDRTAIAEALLGRAIHIIIVASDLNVTDAVAELKKMRAAINEELAPYEAEQAP